MDVTHPIAGESQDAWDWLQDVRDAGGVVVMHRKLGHAPVVYTLNGVSMDLRTTGWCLTHEPALTPEAAREAEAEGRDAAAAAAALRRPNVGFGEVVLRPGDALLFELLPMGGFPARREDEPADVARREADAKREKEEAEAAAADQDL